MIKYNSTVLLLFSVFVNAQNQTQDSIKVLTPVEISNSIQTPDRKPIVEKNIIYAGKKNDVIKLGNAHANLVTNNAREVFSRVPGVSVWENDGSGIQINVAVRGLSPNRSWELNTRQNGYDISSDVFGYPEAYYNPPLQAVEKIELLKGGSALQFGSQFGGMLNYVLKRESTKPFTFETQNTIGSYGMLASFNAIGGKYKKWSYYAYNDSRKGDGWRNNSGYTVRNSHAFLKYNFTESTSLSAEYTNMDYSMKQPGGLTDAEFKLNPRYSKRERNWFGTPWNLFSVNLDTQFSKNLTFNAKLFGLLGQRNSVGYVSGIDNFDVQNPTSLLYSNRQVDRDYYKNYGIETRSIYTYLLFGKEQNLAFGARAYRANMERFQKGNGTIFSDFNLNVENNKFPTALNLQTKNIAFFAENVFKFTENLTITPGVRYENIESSIDGRLNVTTGNDVLAKVNTVKRTKFLFGFGAQYAVGSTNFYTNVTQAYRPVLASEITPPATTDVIDPNLKDADGYTFDIGYRGEFRGILNFDVSYFYMQYNNRVGNVRKFINDDVTKGTNLFRTNLGESVNKGFEGFVGIDFTKLFKVDSKYGRFNAFTSVSYISSKYIDFKKYTATGTAPKIVIKEENLGGNRVENAPRYINTFGFTWSLAKFSATYQTKITSDVFTDADNTVKPSKNAQTGWLAGYKVHDLALDYKFLKRFNANAGINNVFNQQYATRRAGGYPGPGLLPNDGRTYYLTLGYKM